jgi:hypothetical protein
MNWIRSHAAPILFTLAYTAFMSVSIPKIGAIFLLYSGEHSLIWVIASYGAAITIDALIGFLTYSTTSKKRDWYTQLGIWLFVLIFAGYSFYLNWIYDLLHLPPANTVWELPSLIPGWNTQQLTTVLVSAIPLGILAFTLIARLIREEKNVVSLDDLRSQVLEIKERTVLHQQISDATMERNVARAKGWISAGKEVLSGVFSATETERARTPPFHGHTATSETIPTEDQDVDGVAIQRLPCYDLAEDAALIEQASGNIYSPEKELDTGKDIAIAKVAIQNGHCPDIPPDIDRGENLEDGYAEKFGQGDNTSQSGNSGPIEPLLTRSTRRLYISLKEAVITYGYAETYLSKLASRGTIRTKRADRSMLLVSSLETYIAKNGRKTRGLIGQQTVS